MRIVCNSCKKECEEMQLNIHKDIKRFYCNKCNNTYECCNGKVYNFSKVKPIDKTKQYIIIRDLHPYAVEIEVNKAIEMGYTPHGNLVYIDSYYCREMVKDIKND